jgi:AcrR family transcriptional regulator
MAPVPNSDTRARLIESGTRAFTEIGHDRVNLVRDILDPAGVGPGSFYRLFDDKTDLLDAIIADVAVRRMAYVLDARGDTVDELVDELLVRFLDSVDVAEHAWDLHFRESGSSHPRIRHRVRLGRAAWIDRVAKLIGDRTGLDNELARRASQWLVVVAAGYVETYFELPGRERTERRERLRADVLVGAGAGVRALVGSFGM